MTSTHACRRGRAFTLIELLIAFAVSTVLLGAIYFFYIGFLHGSTATGAMAIRDMDVDTALDGMRRDLALAVQVLELHPRQIRFKRRKLPRGALGAMDLETRQLETVEYRVAKREGMNVLMVQVGFETPVELFKVRECGEEVFRGYVLQPPPEPGKKGEFTPASFPRFRIFDTVTQSSSDVSRIPLVRITLRLSDGGDRLDVVTKVFMTQVYASLVEPDWNAE